MGVPHGKCWNVQIPDPPPDRRCVRMKSIAQLAATKCRVLWSDVKALIARV